MSKLDREIKAVMEEALEQGQQLAVKMIPIMVDEDSTQSEKEKKLLDLIQEASPKKYDDYVKDMKNVFISNGWKES